MSHDMERKLLRENGFAVTRPDSSGGWNAQRECWFGSLGVTMHVKVDVDTDDDEFMHPSITVVRSGGTDKSTGRPLENALSQRHGALRDMVDIALTIVAKANAS